MLAAARWITRLADAESGRDEWMAMCVPFVGQLLQQEEHRAWVERELRQGRSLDELAGELCEEAWDDGRDNRRHILECLDWAAATDRPLLWWALDRHWEEMERIQGWMGRSANPQTWDQGQPYPLRGKRCEVRERLEEFVADMTIMLAGGNGSDRRWHEVRVEAIEIKRQ